MPTIHKRIQELENIVRQHLVESGGIKAHLKWNTTITCITLTAILGKLCVEFFKH